MLTLVLGDGLPDHTRAPPAFTMLLAVGRACPSPVEGVSPPFMAFSAALSHPQTISGLRSWITSIFHLYDTPHTQKSPHSTLG